MIGMVRALFEVHRGKNKNMDLLNILGGKNKGEKIKKGRQKSAPCRIELQTFHLQD